MRLTVSILVVMAAVGCATLEKKTEGPMRCWAVDPLVKVFHDAAPEAGAAALAEVARGEHASFQVVVRADAGITGLTA